MSSHRATAGCHLREREPIHIGVSGPSSPQLFAVDLGLAREQLPPGLGGTPVNHLVRSFLDLGHRVTLVTLDQSVAPGNTVRHENGALSLFVGPYRHRHRARDRFAAERDAIRRAFEKAQPDAISAHWSYEYALGAIDSGVPTLVTVRDVPREVFRLQPSPYRLVRWSMHREALRRAAAIAFNSPYTREALTSKNRDEAPVLANALPDGVWRLPKRRAPDPSRPTFVSVNNGFGRRKNVGTLLRAFALLRNTIPGARLALVGSGFEEAGPAGRWARPNAVEYGVTFVGPLGYEATQAAIQQSDVLVHPALEESFGFTIIEAASVGTPVIAGERSGAVPWVLGDGAQGVLVDVTSPHAIASAMAALVMDAERWDELRSRAFGLGRLRFSASAVAQQYVHLLEELVAHARAARIG
jgi:L-malate glycosyltransferase